MCLSAHNYLTFGLTGHIITWVLDCLCFRCITRISREEPARCTSFAHTTPNKKRTWRKSRSVALTSSERTRRLVPALTVGTKLADELLGALDDCLTTRLQELTRIVTLAIVNKASLNVLLSCLSKDKLKIGVDVDL